LGKLRGDFYLAAPVQRRAVIDIACRSENIHVDFLDFRSAL
jgi:hypothetical protein